MQNTQKPEKETIVITAIEHSDMGNILPLSSKLRIIRENVFGLARPAFAELMGISASTWKNYELKYRNPDVWFLSNLYNFIRGSKKINQGKDKDFIILLIDDKLTGSEFLDSLSKCCTVVSYHYSDKIAALNKERAQAKQFA